MALTPAQRQIAALIMGQGARAGLSPARQRELVAASYAESGLNPRSVNSSSGAAGLFQLLSSGYRQKAQSLGGLFNPQANTQAILSDYVNYWRSHPQALPGEAGRDVERSGMGASFYSRPLGLIGGVSGAPGVPGAGPAQGAGPVAPGGVNFAQTLRQGLLQALLHGRQPNIPGLVQGARQAAVRQPHFADAAAAPALAPPVAPVPRGVPARGGYPSMVQHAGAIPGFVGLSTAPQADASHVDTRILTLLSTWARTSGHPVQIISGYRSPGYSAKVGGYSNDPHTRGVAVDAYVNGVPIGNVPGFFKWAQQHGLESGAQPGFYRGKTDPEHVQIPGSGVNKSVRARRTYGR